MSESVPVKIVSDYGDSFVTTHRIIQKDGSVTSLCTSGGSRSEVSFSDDLTTAYIYVDKNEFGDENPVSNVLAFYTFDEKLTYMVLQLKHKSPLYMVYCIHKIDANKQKDGTYHAFCALSGQTFKKYGYKQIDSGYYLCVEPNGIHVLNGIGTLNRIDRDFDETYMLNTCAELHKIMLFCTLDGNRTLYVFMKERGSCAGVLISCTECITPQETVDYDKLIDAWKNRQLNIPDTGMVRPTANKK